MIINRTSWHFRLYSSFNYWYKTNGDYLSDTFCRYCQKVFLYSVLTFLFMSLWFIAIFSVAANLTILFTNLHEWLYICKLAFTNENIYSLYQGFAVGGFIPMVLSIIFGICCLFKYIKDEVSYKLYHKRLMKTHSETNEVKKEPSLIKEWINAKKSKFCPTITLK